MKLLLQRTHGNDTSTWGKLFVDSEFFCYTLEDAVREVIGAPVEAWKVGHKTAIPSTEYVGHPYSVTLEASGRFGPNTITINDVPGFKYIRVHPGNTSDDTEGCLLLGTAIDAHGIVGGTSRPAVDKLKSTIVAAGAGAELTVRNIEAVA